ncbi:MAG TPA: NAD-dependent epimerase/dehydratase family protein [Malonomonas sp.]
MKILVTGGGGFIGSHLVDLLLSDGHFVRVLDNFSTGNRCNLQLEHDRLEVQQGDVRDPDTVARATTAIDAIVHLAAVASVQASVDDPVGTHQVNLIGTLNLLEAARKQGIKRFVFASSAAVYGDTQVLPVSESTPLAPLTPYAADKLASEYYIDFYRRQHGLEPVVFRFFNIFGPRQDPSSPYSGVISIFMQRAISGHPITVFGDGEQSRDFVFVADLVGLLRKALLSSAPVCQPMNVGNRQATNLKQLLSMISSFNALPLQISYSAPRTGDIRFSLADNARVQEQFAYAAHSSVEVGLKVTYDWYLSQHKQALSN